MKGSKEPHLRFACIDALGAIGPSGKGTVDALLDVAKEKDKKAPYAVALIVVLGNQGAEAKGAVPYLAAIVKTAPVTLAFTRWRRC